MTRQGLDEDRPICPAMAGLKKLIMECLDEHDKSKLDAQKEYAKLWKGPAVKHMGESLI